VKYHHEKRYDFADGGLFQSSRKELSVCEIVGKLYNNNYANSMIARQRSLKVFSLYFAQFVIV
jgi:hypothetical protein